MPFLDIGSTQSRQLQLSSPAEGAELPGFLPLELGHAADGTAGADV